MNLLLILKSAEELKTAYEFALNTHMQSVEELKTASQFPLNT